MNQKSLGFGMVTMLVVLPTYVLSVCYHHHGDHAYHLQQYLKGTDVVFWAIGKEPQPIW